MSILAANSHVLYNKEAYVRDSGGSSSNSYSSFFSMQKASSGWCWFDSGIIRNKEYSHSNSKKTSKRKVTVEASWPDMTRPSVVEMEPIKDSDQLDQILLQAQELSIPILIDWMAAWCRKCIYLKPKLEKLAAEYDTKIKFYCVDVNNVPQSLVKRGNISKMPTIQQLWKDGEMKAEVIGGHKAWLVVEEVREMIQKFV